MTAETLKPFITPTSDNFPATHTAARMSRRERNCNLLVISLTVFTLVLTTILLGFTVWSSIRICNLESEVKSLDRVIESMQKRLGLNYLDDLHDFEKEYQNALIDNPTLDNIAEDDEEDDDEEDDEDTIIRPDDVDNDEYDEIESYDELVKKYNSYDESEEDEDEDSSNVSDNDNLYDDFEKFKDSKQKKERKSRSIAPAPNALQESATTQTTNQTEELTERQREASGSPLHYRTRRPTARPQVDTLSSSDRQKSHSFVSQHIDDRRSPLRQRTHRRRHKIATLKSGDSILSAKMTSPQSTLPVKAAAHFPLHIRVPDSQDPFSGDMFIGHSSWANKVNTSPFFELRNNGLTVREPGLYYVYAQVCYNNTHDQNGFVIYHEGIPFLQCLNTVPTMMTKMHTCHTSGLIYLQADDTIQLRDFHRDRNVILKLGNNRSYFGIMKI